MRIWPSGYRYDVFLSYAVDDSAVIDALYRSLTRLGLKVWYAKYEVPPGGSLEGQIPDAMQNCRFAVALVSKSYLAEYWTMREYAVFRDREMLGLRNLFTVLYNISRESVKGKGILTDKSTIPYRNDPDEIARRIFYEARYKATDSVGEWLLENSYALRVWSAVAAFLIVGLFGWLYYCDQRPCGLVEPMLVAHIEEFERGVLLDKQKIIASAHLQAASIDDIQKLYKRFVDTKSRHSNAYELSGDGKTVVSAVHIEQALRQDPDLWTPAHAYNLPGAEVLLSPKSTVGVRKKFTFALSNPRPVQYEVMESSLVRDGRYEITVVFKDNIRLLVVELDFPDARDRLKHYSVKFMGFEAQVRYAFVKHGGRWVLGRVEE